MSDLRDLAAAVNRAGDALDSFHDGAIYPCITEADIARRESQLDREYALARGALAAAVRLTTTERV